ncbi:MAG: helix-turn-helix domain-containing protein [Oscillospiraceae bacterium]
MSEITKALPRMRTIKQTAEETGLHEYFIRQLVKQDKIKYVKAGRKVLVNLDKLIEYLETGEQGAAI